MKVAFGTPFDAQLSFFQKKLALPTEWWDDILNEAHDRAFMVAGAMKADLLHDLQQAVEKAISGQSTLQDFRADFKAIVAKHGWTGWTGEDSAGGIAWRTRVIYQTNVATSYAAGRWKQLTDPDLIKLCPYWRYHHADGVLHPRPLHVAWNGLVLPWDHPFWKTHFPPNGWGCHCWIEAVDEAAYQDARAIGKGEAPEGWDTVNEKTGTPPGIDKGFAYAPGANTDTSLRDLVQDKLITYPPAISKALSRDVNRYINASESAATFASRVLADHSVTEPLWLGFVENATRIQAEAGIAENLQGYLVLLPSDAPRHVLLSHGHDGGGQRPAEPADYQEVWRVLAEADRIAPGAITMHGLESLVAWLQIGAEVFRAVFEVRPGKRNRALALLSLVIKTGGGGGG